MPTGHFSLDMLENDPATALDIAKAVGIETIYCPYIAPELRPATARTHAAFGQRLQEVGKPFRDAGLGFGWYNHDFEFRPCPTAPSPVSRSSRVARSGMGRPISFWVVKGGADPLHWIATSRTG